MEERRKGRKIGKNLNSYLGDAFLSSRNQNRSNEIIQTSHVSVEEGGPRVYAASQPELVPWNSLGFLLQLQDGSHCSGHQASYPHRVEVGERGTQKQ